MRKFDHKSMVMQDEVHCVLLQIGLGCAGQFTNLIVEGK